MSLFDLQPVRKSAVLRKALAFSLVPPKAILRNFVSLDDYAANPPIVVNALPKSGTHLLLQIARALPGTRYFGGFIATTPSLTLKERSPQALARRLNAILPGEVVGAHLYHSETVRAALDAVNALHLFIYRDPRDVLLSEAHYLAEMNRWHKMHAVFAKLEGAEARVRTAIEGVDARYPGCAERIAPYLKWLEDAGTLCVRYEDLVSGDRRDHLKRIAAAHVAQTGSQADIDALTDRLAAAIDPAKSHTFREGGAGKWQRQLAPHLITLANARLAAVIETMGYPLSPEAPQTMAAIQPRMEALP